MIIIYTIIINLHNSLLRALVRVPPTLALVGRFVEHVSPSSQFFSHRDINWMVLNVRNVRLFLLNIYLTRQEIRNVCKGDLYFICVCVCVFYN